MGFSEPVAGVLTAINRELEVDQLQTMLSSCIFQDVITQKEKDNITDFSGLVQILSDRCCIEPGNVDLLSTLLEHAGRSDLAGRLHGTILEVDRRNNNLGQNPSTQMTKQPPVDLLKNSLCGAYQPVHNFFPTHQSQETTDVDDIFQEVQLSVKKGDTCGEGLRQPLENYKTLLMNRDKKRVLLKGNTAFGKTTLLRKIVRDWASGKFPYFKVLIVLPLGAMTPECTLGEAVVKFLLSKDRNISADDVDSVAHLLKDKVAILFDEFEEYKFHSPEPCPKEVPENSSGASKPLLIRDIILYQQLRDAFVIVATRPLGAQNFRTNFEESCRAYQQEDVTGFSEDTIDVFVKQFFQEEEKKSASESLLTYLRNNDLKDMVCAPALLRMLCQFWDINQNTQNPPEMINSLFYNMLSGLHRHNRKRQSICSDVPMSSLQDSGDSESSFRAMMLALGAAGFDVLRKQEEVFHLSQLEKGFCSTSCDVKLIQSCMELGLLKYKDTKQRRKKRPSAIDDDRIDSLEDLSWENWSGKDASCSDEDENAASMELCAAVSSKGKLVSFQSNHILWYCVAVHLRELARNNFSSFDKKIKKLIQPFKDVFEKRFVLLFCFSCKDSDANEALNIKIGKSILNLLLKKHQKTLEEVCKIEEDSTDMKVFGLTSQFTKLCLHCNYEAQVGPALIETLAECFGGGEICLVGISEYTTRALEYFLKHSKTSKTPCQVSTLKIVSLGNEVSIASLKEFMKHIPGADNFFRYLMNKYIDMDEDDLTSLKEQLEGDMGGLSYSKDLCKVKKVALLHFMYVIRKWHPHVNVLLPTVEALRHQADNLTDLTLMVPNINNNVWDQVIKILKNGKFHSLEKLDLSFCGLTSNKQLNSLASSFVPSKNNKTFPNLKHLVLSGNRCNKKIIENLMYLTSLEHLSIQECHLTREDFQRLAQSLQDLTALKELDLRRNDFFDENVPDFLNIIRARNLEGLKLCLNNVKGCIPKLVNVIKKKKTLRVLHLNHCPDPLTLFHSCKDIPTELPRLRDFRLSGELPQEDPEATHQPRQMEKIKLLPPTMTTFVTGLRSMTELRTFSFLYCKVDSDNFTSLYDACRYLRSTHKLELMRYSYTALDEKDVKLSRILSRDRQDRLLQLW